MFDKRILGDMRRSGMNIGLSKAKLSQAMLEILIQLPTGTTNLKHTIINNMGLMGQMSATRDINEAWNKTKKKAAKEYPGKFLLDGRGVLHWNDGSVKLLDKEISTVNYKKLNELADAENCSVNQMVSKLIKSYGNRNA
jgi:Ran GTPase-activating protein (RanGAP) involved in mRNA processing and transport